MKTQNPCLSDGTRPFIQLYIVYTVHKILDVFVIQPLMYVKPEHMQSVECVNKDLSVLEVFYSCYSCSNSEVK